MLRLVLLRLVRMMVLLLLPPLPWPGLLRLVQLTPLSLLKPLLLLQLQL